MSEALTEDAALKLLNPEPGLVILMCGVAGSGKTSFSTKLASKGFTRLSIDEEIWGRFGRYGLDYTPEDYPGHVSAARDAIKDVLLQLLARRQPAVVDSSFWSRAHRDSYKELIENAGGAWRLVYLRAPENLLRERLEERGRRFDANAAFPIGADELTKFLKDFQTPIDEGEMVIEFT
jgi:predicted kinase